MFKLNWFPRKPNLHTDFDIRNTNFADRRLLPFIKPSGICPNAG